MENQAKRGSQRWGFPFPHSTFSFRIFYNLFIIYLFIRPPPSTINSRSHRHSVWSGCFSSPAAVYQLASPSLSATSEPTSVDFCPRLIILPDAQSFSETSRTKASLRAGFPEAVRAQERPHDSDKVTSHSPPCFLHL